MGPSKTPTKEEREWMGAIVDFGCLCCFLDGHPNTPPSVHHILRGGRRIDHLHTLPLCERGHHQPDKRSGKLSVHYDRAAFKAKYGTEMELLDKMRELIYGPLKRMA